MARGCCGEGRCYCVVEQGENVTVTGNGSADSPYVINANPDADPDHPPGVTWVRYDAVSGWPARPDVPADWIVICINEVDNTPPPTGVGQYISLHDIALLALPVIP